MDDSKRGCESGVKLSQLWMGWQTGFQRERTLDKAFQVVPC